MEDEAKEKSGKQIYTKTKDNSWKKQRKGFHDESRDEPTGLDKLLLGESYRINHFLPIIDFFISVHSQKMAAYYY